MIEVERALVTLGRELDVPDTPDLTTAVRAGTRPRVAPSRTPRRRLVVAIALGVAAALAVTFAVPDARSALFRILRIGSERIERVERLPRVAPRADLGRVLGERVSLGEARARAGFALRELDVDPDRTYLDARGTVWLVYGDLDRPRLLVAQTPAQPDDSPAVIKKLVVRGTEMEAVRVGEGQQGLFVTGEPHVVYLLDERGRPLEERAWLGRSVLLWEEGGITYRIEGDLTRDEALEIAASLR